MFKKPKPGKKRLVKWPKKLVPLYDDKARRRLLAVCLPGWKCSWQTGQAAVSISCARSGRRKRVGLYCAAQRRGQAVPAQDEHAPDAQAFAEEHFYAWQYERPASPWLFALSALLVVVVMAFCLFPLAPHWCAALRKPLRTRPPLQHRVGYPRQAAGLLPVSLTCVWSCLW